MMAHYVRNVGSKHAVILQRQLAPGEELNLEGVFVGFCKPKISSRDQRKLLEADPSKLPIEFESDQFNEFLEWARMLGKDRAIWEFEERSETAAEAKAKKKKKLTTEEPAEMAVAAQPAVPSGRKGGAAAKQTINPKDIKRKIPSSKQWTPKDLAWMEWGDDAKRVVENLSADQVKVLKAAHKLARNISGQERMVKLLQNKIDDMAMEGIS